MSKGKIAFVAVAGIVFLLAISLYGFFKGTYNRFVSMDEAVKITKEAINYYSEQLCK